MKSTIHIFLLIATLVISACGPTLVGRSSFPEAEPGSSLFLKAEQAYRSSAYPKALQLYNDYLSRYPEGDSAPKALMREGEIYEIQNEYQTARNVYQFVVDNFPESPLAPKAMSRILSTYYSEGRYKDVIRAADSFLRHPVGLRKSEGIYTILGDTYMAMDSPINAVYFYAKANTSPMAAGERERRDRLKSAVRGLSNEDILSLLERVQDQTTRGYLAFQMGHNDIDAERYDSAIRTLTQYISMFPDHEHRADAEAMLQNIEGELAQFDYGRHTIGCLLPLTGSYKLYGNRALRGVELALKHAAAGDAIQMIVKDTGSNDGQAEVAVGELAQANVSVIIGPIITAEAAAMAAQDVGIPMIVLSQKENVTDIGDYIFRNFITPEVQVRALASYAVENLGVNHFAVLYPDEKYGTTFRDLFWQEAASRGASVTAVEPYDVNQTDFAGPIRKLARNRGDFQAIFIPDAPSKTGLILPQLAFHNVRGVHLLGTNLWHSDKLVQMAKEFGQGAILPEVFFTESSLPKVIDFVREFRTAYGETPGFIEALAYDTTMMLLEVFSRPAVRNPEAVREALLSLLPYQGVTGLTAFDETGDVRKSLYMLRLDGNQFVELGSSQF